MNPLAALQLADWRRQTADLYARVREQADPAAAHALWRDGRDQMMRPVFRRINSVMQIRYAWSQTRRPARREEPLVYAVVFLDAIVVKVRTPTWCGQAGLPGGRIDADGEKHVLGQ